MLMTQLLNELSLVKKEHQRHLDSCKQDELRLKRRDDSGDGEGGKGLDEPGVGTSGYQGGQTSGANIETDIPETSQIEGNQEAVEATPLMVDMPGNTVFSEEFIKAVMGDNYEYEEGEFLADITKEMVAEYFNIPVDKVVMPEVQATEADTADEQTTPEMPPGFETTDSPPKSTTDDFDVNVEEGEVEDGSDEEPEMYGNDQFDMPTFAELSGDAGRSELGDRIPEERKKGVEDKRVEVDADEAAKIYMAEFFQKAHVEYTKEKTKVVQLKRVAHPHSSNPRGGKIISWHWLSDLKVYAIRREFCVDYVANHGDFRTWKVYEFQDLIHKPFYNRSKNELRDAITRILKNEFRLNYPNLRPQFPKTWWSEDWKRGGWRTFHLSVLLKK